MSFGETAAGFTDKTKWRVIIMSNVSPIRKVYSAAYKTPRGDFHREVLYEDELEVFYKNLEEDNCRLLYCDEADLNDIPVVIKTSDDAQLRYIIELATSEMYQRLIGRKHTLINHGIHLSEGE